MQAMRSFGHEKDFLPDIIPFCKQSEFIRIMERPQKEKDEKVNEYFQPIKRCMDSEEKKGYFLDVCGFRFI